MVDFAGGGLLNNVGANSPLLSSKIPGTNIQATDGWYVAIGCIGAILLAATPIAPVILAVMTIATLYQLENLIQGT